MNYVPFLGGTSTLKNKQTCKPYSKRESIHLLWTSHQGTFINGGRVRQSGPCKNLQSCPPIAKQKSKKKKKMNKTGTRAPNC